MVMFTKEDLIEDRLKEMEIFGLKMVKYMMVNGKTIKCLEMEIFNLKKEYFMMENGKTINLMEKVLL